MLFFPRNSISGDQSNDALNKTYRTLSSVILSKLTPIHNLMQNFVKFSLVDNVYT